jgi:DNA polymerase-3 subunit gamma/tau
VEDVEKAHPMVAPALKQAALVSLTDGHVAIQLPPGLFAQTAERKRSDIEAALGRFFGRPTALAITVREAPPAPEAAQGGAAPAPSIAQTEAAERQARSARVREAARSHPNVREAARVLDGDIEKIEEL